MWVVAVAVAVVARRKTARSTGVSLAPRSSVPTLAASGSDAPPIISEPLLRADLRLRRTRSTDGGSASVGADNAHSIVHRPDMDTIDHRLARRNRSRSRSLDITDPLPCMREPPTSLLSTLQNIPTTSHSLYGHRPRYTLPQASRSSSHGCTHAPTHARALYPQTRFRVVKVG